MALFPTGFLKSLFLCTCICVFLADAGKGPPSKKNPKQTAPAAGWCKNRHSPLKPAQSGYEGYCKACYRDAFPKKCAAKQKLRQAACLHCRKTKDIGAQGYCRSCCGSRQCETCNDLNRRRKASICSRCQSLREGLGALQPRLALWCLACTSDADRSEQLCRSCLQTSRAAECTECGAQGAEMNARHTCAASDCSASVHLCLACVPLTRGARQPRCRKCWIADGEPCIHCETGPARHQLNKFRS